MAASGFQSSMTNSINSNAKLLNRNNLNYQLKEIDSSSEGDLKSQLTHEEIEALRLEESKQLKKSILRRRLILFLVIIPVAIIIGAAFYLLVQALM